MAFFEFCVHMYWINSLINNRVNSFDCEMIYRIKGLKSSGSDLLIILRKNR